MKLSENTTNQNRKSNFLSHIAVVLPETQALDIASCSYLFQNPHLPKAVNPTEKKNSQRPQFRKRGHNKETDSIVTQFSHQENYPKPKKHRKSKENTERITDPQNSSTVEKV